MSTDLDTNCVCVYVCLCECTCTHMCICVVYVCVCECVCCMWCVCVCDCLNMCVRVTMLYMCIIVCVTVCVSPYASCQCVWYFFLNYFDKANLWCYKINEKTFLVILVFLRSHTKMASNGQEGHGGQPPDNDPSSLSWPLSSLQSRYTRSAMDMAQELLPNLPRRAVSSSAAGQRSNQSTVTSEGQVSLDMSSLMSREDGQGESVTISPQVGFVLMMSCLFCFYYFISFYCICFFYWQFWWPTGFCRTFLLLVWQGERGGEKQDPTNQRTNNILNNW